MIAIGIVGHVDRDPHTLADQVAADHVSVDDGTLGSGRNHLRLLEMMRAASSAWTVVLEDDAMPVDGFRDQLQMALAVAPSDVVGLYVGGPPIYPPCRRSSVCGALRRADEADAHWITADVLLHAVGYAIRADRLPAIVADVRGDHWDAALSAWTAASGITVAHCHPSLVDHADGEPVITKRVGTSARGPRRAWRVGTRTTWTASAVKLHGNP